MAGFLQLENNDERATISEDNNLGRRPAIDKDPPLNTSIAFSREYYPPGVSEVIGYGRLCFIGYVDGSGTVLKYQKHPEKEEHILQIEAQLLEVLGNHPRIIESYGLTEHGLSLEFAYGGNLNDFIVVRKADITLEQRLYWCNHDAEAVCYIHEKNILHCDINSRNFLLNYDCNLLLADFQGVLKSIDGEVLLDGLSREGAKYYCPRADSGYADVKTDLFTLGSVIYFIMMGHEVFQDLNTWEHDEEIKARFGNGHFPTDNHLCSEITGKCWEQSYESAEEVLFDLSQVRIIDPSFVEEHLE
ncbi:kinase-like protein [Aspergillus californicus]